MLGPQADAACTARQNPRTASLNWSGRSRLLTSEARGITTSFVRGIASSNCRATLTAERTSSSPRRRCRDCVAASNRLGGSMAGKRSISATTRSGSSSRGKWPASGMRNDVDVRVLCGDPHPRLLGLVTDEDAILGLQEPRIRSVASGRACLRTSGALASTEAPGPLTADRVAREFGIRDFAAGYATSRWRGRDVEGVRARPARAVGRIGCTGTRPRGVRAGALVSRRGGGSGPRTRRRW